jgi:hypothetical protein
VSLLSSNCRAMQPIFALEPVRAASPDVLCMMLVVLPKGALADECGCLGLLPLVTASFCKGQTLTCCKFVYAPFLRRICYNVVHLQGFI